MSDNFAIHDMEFEEFLYESVTMDTAIDLDGEFRKISGAIAYWNARYADAIEEHLKAEMDHKQEKARLYLHWRTTLELGGGRITEAMVTAKVESDPDYIESKVKAIEAEAEKVRLRGYTDAVSAKKDMLQSLGAKLRAEMAGDPTVRDAVTTRRLVSEG